MIKVLDKGGRQDVSIESNWDRRPTIENIVDKTYGGESPKRDWVSSDYKKRMPLYKDRNVYGEPESLYSHPK